MKKYYYNKLVRDKIPNIINSRGGDFKTKIVSSKSLLVLLKKKLIEESKEVSTASKEELLGELADVLQIIESMGNLEGYKFRDIQSKVKEKAKTNGVYKKGIFLIWSDKPKGFGDKVKNKK